MAWMPAVYFSIRKLRRYYAMIINCSCSSIYQITALKVLLSNYHCFSSSFMILQRKISQWKNFRRISYRRQCVMISWFGMTCLRIIWYRIKVCTSCCLFISFFVFQVKSTWKQMRTKFFKIMISPLCNSLGMYFFLLKYSTEKKKKHNLMLLFCKSLLPNYPIECVFYVEP